MRTWYHIQQYSFKKNQTRIEVPIEERTRIAGRIWEIYTSGEPRKNIRDLPSRDLLKAAPE